MSILIFGVSGMIGHRIWLELSQQESWHVFGMMRNRSSFSIFDDRVIKGLDVNNWFDAEALLEKVRPRFIINAIGITLRKPEIAHWESAIAINSLFPRKLLKWAQANEAKVIHLSTDCVFDGAEGKYLELSQPSAQDIYGQTKFLGEIEGSNALTLRFSCIGRELSAHTELLDWFLAQKSTAIKGYSKAMYSGLSSLVIAREIHRMIRDYPQLEGIYQLSSEPISKYDLLKLAKKAFAKDIEIERFDDYIADKTLDSEKYKKATGFISPSWEEMMTELAVDKRVSYKNL